MIFQPGIDGPEPLRRAGGRLEERRVARTSLLAIGTLACPSCDAPIAPPLGPCSPGDPLACGFCDHTGAVRDFLSLAAPSRPTRVDVRVVRRLLAAP
jgi:hypothetical protein